MLTEITLRGDEEGDFDELIANLHKSPKMRNALFEITANLNKRAEWYIDARPDISAQEAKEYIMDEIFQIIKDEGLTEQDFQ